MIHVKPLVKDPIITHDNRHTPNNVTQLYTTEGQPLQFNALSIKDNDGIEGTYRVRVSVDSGATLWVRQDIRDDVVFFPKVNEMKALSIMFSKPCSTVLFEARDFLHSDIVVVFLFCTKSQLQSYAICT